MDSPNVCKRSDKEIQKIYDTMDDNERFGLSFGLFPARLMQLKLNNCECAKLVEISQKKTGGAILMVKSD